MRSNSKWSIIKTYDVPIESGETHLIKIKNTHYYIDNPRFQVRVTEDELAFKHNEIMKNEGVKFMNVSSIGGVIEVSFKGVPNSVYLTGGNQLRSNENGSFRVQILNNDFVDTMNDILRNYEDLEILELIRY